MSGNDLPEVMVILGPTAVGKTGVGIKVAENINGEIISVDSRQIYRGMEIGSGAPSGLELDRALHHLVSCIEPEVRLSAGEYARMAFEAVCNVLERGKIPVVVGGSGLYLRALFDGLAPIPPPDLVKRREIELRIDSIGMESSIEELRRIDPEYAEKVGIHDRKRLIRALEVYETTGKTLSDWHRSQLHEAWCNPKFFGLDRPRQELHQLIVNRVESMLKMGWIEEIRKLIIKYEDIKSLPPVVTEALGYRDLLRYIEGEISLDEAKEQIIISTRQFAKRQITWFKSVESVQWLVGSGRQAIDDWHKQIISSVKVIESGLQTREALC